MQRPSQMLVDGVGVEMTSLAKPIVWADLFGNANPVELEIGMGKGAFLTDVSKSHPQTNFFGLEYARFYWRYSSDRLRRNLCLNVRTACSEAAFFFREHVASASLSVIHIYFPDPWPKKRHNKRRLIQPPFVQQVAAALQPGGMLKVVTDHTDYFQQIDQVLRTSTLQVVDYSRPETAADGELVGTNFERKYRREGRPFHSIAAIRGQ